MPISRSIIRTSAPERFVTLSVALAEAMPQRVQGMLFLDWIMTRPEATFFQAVVRLEQARTHLGILERPVGMAAARPFSALGKG
ncbi:hypothetical protein [Serratia ficaria]|uniref:hypothetical protein n=1 Tax=Serratia ficaria TaxID=61651 RepID=UPI0021C717B4|nr:hypothetical protein [Serratia ficaria]